MIQVMKWRGMARSTEDDALNRSLRHVIMYNAFTFVHYPSFVLKVHLREGLPEKDISPAPPEEIHKGLSTIPYGTRDSSTFSRKGWHFNRRQVSGIRYQIDEVRRRSRLA